VEYQLSLQRHKNRKAALINEVQFGIIQYVVIIVWRKTHAEGHGRAGNRSSALVQESDATKPIATHSTTSSTNQSVQLSRFAQRVSDHNALAHPNHEHACSPQHGRDQREVPRNSELFVHRSRFLNDDRLGGDLLGAEVLAHGTIQDGLLPLTQRFFG